MTRAHPRVGVSPADPAQPAFPAVEYERHPAFAHFPRASADLNQPVRELLGEIDSALRRASGRTLGRSERRLEAWFRVEIDERLRELFEIALRSVGSVGLEREALRHVATTLRPTLLDHAFYEGTRHRFEAEGELDLAGPIAARMRDAGVFATIADPGRVQALARLAAPHARELDAAAARSPARRHRRKIPQDGTLWKALVGLLRDTGFLSGLSVYDRHPLQVDWVEIVRSSAEQTWWQTPYASEAIGTSRCAYFHNDHSHRTLKTLLYLGEVSAETGPFGYVAASHRWARSPTAAAFVKALDQGRYAAWCARHPESAGEYRPYLADPQFREGFMQLPAPLRATSHFGDDVLDGTALAARLLAAEQVFFSDDANCVAFDGDRGVHRGGLVRAGTRWALQIGYKEVRPKRSRVRQHAKRWVRRTLAKVR